MTSTHRTHGRKTFVAITATIAKTSADQFPPPWHYCPEYFFG